MSKYFIQVKRMIEDYLSKKIDIEMFIRKRFYRVWYDESLKLSDAEFKILDGIFWDLEWYEPKAELREGDYLYVKVPMPKIADFSLRMHENSFMEFSCIQKTSAIQTPHLEN